METWKDVEGYEGFYQVSDAGRVRSLDRYVPGKNGAKQLKRGKVLRATKGAAGYLHCTLYRDGDSETKNIHRLVAEAFIPNGEGHQCINHKDGIKTNNAVDNLEWCTHKQNTRHAWGTGLAHMTDKHRESARKVGKRNGKRVLCSNGVIYPSSCEAARQLGTTQGNIWLVINGKRKHANGYTFEYV